MAWVAALLGVECPEEAGHRVAIVTGQALELLRSSILPL